MHQEQAPGILWAPSKPFSPHQREIPRDPHILQVCGLSLLREATPLAHNSVAEVQGTHPTRGLLCVRREPRPLWALNFPGRSEEGALKQSSPQAGSSLPLPFSFPQTPSQPSILCPRLRTNLLRPLSLFASGLKQLRSSSPWL